MNTEKQTDQQLIQRVIDWGERTGILEHTTSDKQTLKLLSEYGELADQIVKNNHESIKNEYGDCLVVKILLWSINTTDQEKTNLTNSFERIKKSVYREFLLMLEHVDISSAMIFYIDEMLANLDHNECLELAVTKIEKRKGKMINGVFVKEADFEI